MCICALLSYSKPASELAVLQGHPEEVYAIEFLHRGAATAAADALVAASSESLFLWDLRVGRMIHEAMPPLTFHQQQETEEAGEVVLAVTIMLV